MGTPAVAGKLTLPIRGTAYPVVLPTWRDPRLHLAAVIVSLQVLGQVAFEFRLSIAQILVAVLVCAVLEVAIVFRRERVIMWPASALLTGNGVAFVLRVPGTEHGDWWSLHGWWIFAGAAALALLSKYLIRYRGRHVFNPSNIGLVVVFLALGPERADPLDLWWGPMSPWLALALAIIVAGGFAILGRLRLLGIAVGFWLAFAAGAAVLAASGHEMTARWHVGPVTGWEFWRVLVFSPEILVFLFFMITDPKTIPAGRAGRRAYAIGIGLLAVLLIAPFSTEFATKVAVLGALALACAARPPLVWLRSRTRLSTAPTHRISRAAAAAPRFADGPGGSGFVLRPRRAGRDPGPVGGRGRERARRAGAGAPRGDRRRVGGRRPDRPQPRRCRSRTTSSPTCASRRKRCRNETSSVRRRARAAPACRSCGSRFVPPGRPSSSRSTTSTGCASASSPVKGRARRSSSPRSRGR